MKNHQPKTRRFTSKKSVRGTAMMEFALILPILLLVVFGIINFGIVMFDQAIITNAAREGARWGAVNTTSTTKANCGPATATGNGDPCQVANHYASVGLVTFGTGTVSTSSTGEGTAHSLVTVTVTYDYKGIGYSFSIFEKQLTATAVMYHE